MRNFVYRSCFFLSKKGIIHSLESFGAADGPGVRFVVFLKGCNMRCRYCHNPDSWSKDNGVEITVDELMKKIMRYKSYWGEEGGITVSGGEPLLQIEFVTELFRAAHSEGINTVLDTSGNPFTRSEPFFNQFNTLMDFTDLVLLDIKEINNKRHVDLTAQKNDNILDMARYLSAINKPVWIRHVLVPGYSDFDDDLRDLGDFISSLTNVRRVEVLPYHTLGVFKWEKLGIKYTLDGVSPPDKERIKNAREYLKTDRY